MRMIPKRPILRALKNPVGSYALMSKGAGVMHNPQHANGDEWWEYSADLDAGGAPYSVWSNITAVAPPGFSFAHTGDVQYGQSLGIIGAIRVHVSGLHNGKWYNCVFTRDVDHDGSWISQSCVQQGSGHGNAQQYNHPGYGFTTPQSTYLPSHSGSIFRRLANRVMGRR